MNLPSRRHLSVAVSVACLVGMGPPSAAATSDPATRDTRTPPMRATASAGACPQLDASLPWYGRNRQRLQGVIDRRGTCRGNPTTAYAVFDWDNTVIKNDISDQTVFWMIRHGRFKQPPHRNWRRTSPYMTDAAARRLRRVCGPLAAPGERIPTGRRTRGAIACADELVSLRTEEETTTGKPGFRGFNARRMQGSYAWVAGLLQGLTPRQVHHVAARARRAALDAPKNATQRVGSTRQTAWIRYNPQVRDLIRTLKRAGIEPWVVSASPKLFADVWSARVGIDRRHTIGIRTLLRDGRVVAHLQGCGGFRDGSDELMPYILGKRCWINQVVLGIDGRRAMRQQPWRRRPVIAGGDATTDVTMLRDATGAHLTVNRNKPELMCHAYDNADGRWVVNPMFIQPLPRQEERYPCSSTAFTRADGEPGKVRRSDGSVIPDQADTVYAG